MQCHGDELLGGALLQCLSRGGSLPRSLACEGHAGGSDCADDCIGYSVPSEVINSHCHPCPRSPFHLTVGARHRRKPTPPRSSMAVLNPRRAHPVGGRSLRGRRLGTAAQHASMTRPCACGATSIKGHGRDQSNGLHIAALSYSCRLRNAGELLKPSAPFVLHGNRLSRARPDAVQSRPPRECKVT